MCAVNLGSFLLLCFSPLFVKTESRSSLFSVRKNTEFLTNGATLRSEEAHDLMSCARRCEKEDLCRFSNYDERSQICFLAKATAADDAGRHWKEREDFTGIEKVNHDVSHIKGTRRELPVPNCKDLLAINPASTSGVYWIDPDGGYHDNAFKAYCDQVTDGGGWTLVWSYHFTDYPNFNSKQNAITPRPNWVVVSSDVDISTTPPLSENQYDAVEFSLWKEIGSEVLIKSNINNWITCKPGTGSLVDWVAGSVTCRLIRMVNRVCVGIVPTRLTLWNHGPAFEGPSSYYYFDGYKGNDWPTHDPCGTNHPNELNGVDNPHGNIFIR